jgi:uncharacterized membrane protein YdcZ (DUF606 family)
MSIAAGFAGSIQAAVLGRLGDRVGTIEAVGFSTLVAGTTGIVVAAAIDRFGWFGVDRIPLEWTRVIGILLPAGGAALLLRK